MYLYIRADMYKYVITLSCIFGCVTNIFAKSYWQQQVDYKIDVSLNDQNHTLTGFVEFKYLNRSPDTLTYLYIHAWPNAYKHTGTPLAKQMLENGKKDFHFSKPAQRGYIDSLDFKANAEACRWQFQKSSDEIILLTLNSPLLPGQSVTITTPFFVKLPETFSRLGHIGQSYQITQWYPKPAVYDKDGWHAMPYLDQGEFYSEFGSFDVKITLPENYRVGATGDLQNTTELRWLDSLHLLTENTRTFTTDMKFPASSPNTKTLYYKQTNVHDFAWFADKRYHVLKSAVALPNSKDSVTTWAFFTNNQATQWKKAPEYLNDAIYYYSLWLGDYPYKQATAVDGTISAGGGMEYPNVTVIGETQNDFLLDVVITHEVGHNWFYGILGTNERQHGWMDEGLNSFYEARYIQTKYPNRKLVNKVPKFLAKWFDFGQYPYHYLTRLGYLLLARENRDQPIATTSADFTSFNYGAVMYGKSALVLGYLEAWLGKDSMDKAMKQYYEQWKFKHPSPADFRNAIETATGQQLDWLFNQLIESNQKLDYSIHSAKRITGSGGNDYRVRIRNLADVNGPVILAAQRKDSTLSTYLLSGAAQIDTLLSLPTGATHLQIDPLWQMPEINAKNNRYRLNALAARFQKLRFQFLGSLENERRNQVFFAPYLAWNNYDKTQVGLAFYNTLVPGTRFKYLLVPAIGTGSKQFIGTGRVAWHSYPQQGVQQFTVGLHAKRFSYLLFPQNLMLQKVEPYMNFEFKKRNPRNPFTHYLFIRSVNVWHDRIMPDKQTKTLHYYVNEVRYRMERNTTLHPFNVQATFQQGDQFAGLWAEGNFKINYGKRNEGLRVRVFAGGFPLYTKPSNDINAPLPRLYLSTVTNNTFAYWLQKDYMFDEDFIDRNGRDNVLARQVALTGAAFRSVTTFGSSRKFLSSVNISSGIHRFVPVVPFVNAAVIVNDLNKTEFAAEFGLSIPIIPGMAEIHLPLLTTKNIRENQKILGLNKWYQRFSFTLKWQRVKPLELIRNFM